MSTNYYFKIKRSKEIKDKIRQLLNDENINHLIFNSVPNEDVWVFSEKIHIGKNANGWKPLFAKTEHYSSIKEMIQFYNDNKNNLIIIDEYDSEITLDILIDIMINKTGGKSNEDYEEKSVIFNDLFTRTIYEDEEGYQFESLEFN